MVAVAAERTQTRLNDAVWKRRGRVEDALVNRNAQVMARFFNEQAAILQRILEAKYGPLEAKAKPTPDAFPLDFTQTYWSQYTNSLTKAITPMYKVTAAASYADVSELLGIEVALNLNGRHIERVLGTIGLRVKGITETSRIVLANIIKRGIEDGSSPETIAKALLRSANLWGGGKSNVSASRAMTVARTETANAYNQSTLAAYQDSGLVKKLVCLDSPDCGWTSHNDPEAAQNRECTYADAAAHPLSHPNCVRAFAPKLYPTKPIDEPPKRNVAGTGTVTRKPAEDLYANPKTFPATNFQINPATNREWIKDMNAWGEGWSPTFSGGTMTYVRPGPGMTQEEANALAGYMDGDFRRINPQLRDGIDHGVGANINAIDSIIARSTIPEATFVRRGTSESSIGLRKKPGFGYTPQELLAHAKTLVGTTIADDAYLSTSVGEGFTGYVVNFEITLPKGQHAVYISSLNEAEVLLPRGQKLLIESVELRGQSAFSGGRLFIKARAVP